MKFRHIFFITCMFMAVVVVFGCDSDEKTSTEPTEPTIVTKVVRDIDFEPRRIFDLGRLPLMRAKGDTLPEPDKYDFQPGDSIIKCIAYLDDRTPDTAIRFARPEAILYVDPEDTLSDDPDQVYKTQAWVETVDEIEYYCNPTGFRIQFLRPMMDMDHILGVYMEVKRAGGQIDTIGDISTLPYRLKLIKPAFHIADNHHVWEYEWKNIYRLGDLTNIYPAALEGHIYKGTPQYSDRPNPDDLSHQDGVEYIRILGLDRGDDYSQGIPDNQIDRMVYVDPLMGWLIFPTRHPFASNISFARDQAGNFVFLDDPVPEMYQYACPSNLQHCQTYYLVVSYRQP